MGIEILQQPSVVWPVDLNAEEPHGSFGSYTQQAQSMYERLAGSTDATYQDCLIYVLVNFGHVDMKQLTPSTYNDTYGDMCWYKHTHKTPEKTMRLYMKVEEPHTHTRRVVCEWYGKDGGIVILYGATPADTKLWSFGCNHSMATKKRIGSCYNEYSCQCGAKWTVDSSG